MGILELIKAVVVVGPVVGLVTLGFVITVQSGAGCPGAAVGLRRVAGNLSRAMLVLGACVAGFAALQHLAGFRLGMAG